MTICHFNFKQNHHENVTALQVNSVDKYNWTPLHDAALNGHTDTVERLVAVSALTDACVSLLDHAHRCCLDTELIFFLATSARSLDRGKDCDRGRFTWRWRTYALDKRGHERPHKNCRASCFSWCQCECQAEGWMDCSPSCGQEWVKLALSQFVSRQGICDAY
jgi:hypothetical protein